MVASQCRTTTSRTMSSSTQGSSGWCFLFYVSKLFLIASFWIRWKSFFQSTVDRNINLQNLKRASAFIDIMDRHLDTVRHSLLNVVDVILLIPVFQEAQDFLSYYRDVLAKDKMITNKGIYKRYVCGWLCLLRRPSQRYEIEWIGREGLAPETHDAYLKVECALN